MKKLLGLSKYSAAVTFLAFEFFALIAFNFSGSYILFGSLSLALTLLLVLFNFGEIRKRGISNALLLFVPFFVFTLLTALGTYSIAHVYVGDFSWGEVVFIPLGLLGIAFSGYVLSFDKHFKLKTFLMVIFSALAAYVAINLFYNLISFGAFYPVIYKGYYLYYSGIRSELPVNEFAYALEGFKFIEVKMSHYVMYPLLLLASSVMLLYTSVKEEKVSFFAYLGFSVLALLSLVLVPSTLSLGGIAAIAVLVLLVFFAKRFFRFRKVLKIILFVVLGLLMLGYIFFVFNGNSNFDFVVSNPFLKRLFVTNRFVTAPNEVLVNLFSAEKFLGFAANNVGAGMNPEEIHLSGMFIIDTYMTSGVIGALTLFVFIFMGFKVFKKYFHAHLDKFSYQITMLLFAIVFVIFSAFFNDGEYALYYRIYRPIYLTAPFMIMVFMFFYVYSKTELAKASLEEKKEEVSNEEI